jgi:predicted anti-sigma-YlaC factor YlaD
MACAVRGTLSRNALPASNLSSTETPWLAVALGATATAGVGSGALATTFLLEGARADLSVFFISFALWSGYLVAPSSKADALNEC